MADDRLSEVELLRGRVRRLEVLLAFAALALAGVLGWQALRGLAEDLNTSPPTVAWEDNDIRVFVMDGYVRPYVITHLTYELDGPQQVASAQLVEAPIRTESGRFYVDPDALNWRTSDGEEHKPPAPGTVVKAVYFRGHFSR
jgi:hypothetical protein